MRLETRTLFNTRGRVGFILIRGYEIKIKTRQIKSLLKKEKKNQKNYIGQLTYKKINEALDSLELLNFPSFK